MTLTWISALFNLRTFSHFHINLKTNFPLIPWRKAIFKTVTLVTDRSHETFIFLAAWFSRTSQHVKTGRTFKAGNFCQKKIYYINDVTRDTSKLPPQTLFDFWATTFFLVPINPKTKRLARDSPSYFRQS